MTSTASDEVKPEIIAGTQNMRNTRILRFPVTPFVVKLDKELTGDSSVDLDFSKEDISSLNEGHISQNASKTFMCPD